MDGDEYTLRGPAESCPLSADGKMLAFVVGGSDFLDTGRIYAKALPDGEPEALTKALGPIYGPAFGFDGTQVTFTYFTNGRAETDWNILTAPTTGGRPTLLLVYRIPLHH